MALLLYFHIHGTALKERKKSQNFELSHEAKKHIKTKRFAFRKILTQQQQQKN